MRTSDTQSIPIYRSFYTSHRLYFATHYPSLSRLPLVSALNLALQITGATMIALAVAHACMSKVFDWPADTQKLTLINRQVFWAHTAFLTGGIILLGCTCLFFAPALTERTTLGAVAAACFAMCWFSRLAFQFFYFRGKFVADKKLNAFFHYGGSIGWTAYTLVFAALFCYQIGIFGSP